MINNMGMIDRIIRVLLALLVVILYMMGQISGTAAIILGIIAAIFIVTGAVGYCPLYELLGSALADFRVLENFPQETGALMRLLEVVNHLEEEGRGSLRDLLELAEDEKEELFALELPEYTDAVRLLTFHKAKGLGFPVVINRLEEPKGDSGEPFVKEGEDIQLYHLTSKLTGRSAELKRMAEEKGLGGQIQGLNTLYVAATRAREELYNLVVLGKEEGLVFTLFEEGKWGRKGRREKGGEVPPKATPACIPQVREERRVLGERWTYGSWLEAQKGEAYHRVLEELEFLSNRPEAEVSKAVERHRYEQMGFTDPETLKAKLLSFLKHESVKKWFEPKPGRKVLREAEFADENGDLLRMDRVVCDEKEVVVLDFKTGAEKDYREQIVKYKGILKKVFPGKVVKGIVAYVDNGKVVEQ